MDCCLLVAIAVADGAGVAGCCCAGLCHGQLMVSAPLSRQRHSLVAAPAMLP